MKKIILHIPHASVHIPLKDGFLLDAGGMEKEILKLTDWFTDDLFYADDEIIIKAEFSRIFCDPERFSDDSEEIMAQFGMGVLYEKSDAGEVIRKVTKALRERLLNEYYWPHHRQLSAAVNDQLLHYQKALIIDCHSFPNIPLKRDLDQNLKRPDFNIGTDAFHTPQHLIDLSVSFFEKAGYSLGIDWPYKGSLVPLEHYMKNKNVQSIMLEINRSLYIQEPTNEKTKQYLEIKKLTAAYIKTLKSCL